MGFTPWDSDSVHVRWGTDSAVLIGTPGESDARASETTHLGTPLPLSGKSSFKNTNRFIITL